MMIKMEPQTSDWIGGPLWGDAAWPRYRGDVNTARAPSLDPGAPQTRVNGQELILAQESGARDCLRAVLGNARQDHPAIAELEQTLIALFGGFTCHIVRGGWRDEHGRAMVESGLEYSVSGFDVSRGIVAFAKAGRQIGERWVHIEQSRFEAKHCKVNN